MTTTDRTAFLATIAENPEDPTPRLIYADWLDEREDDEPCHNCESGALAFGIDDPGVTMAFCLDCNGTRRVSNGYAQLACDQRLAAKMIEIKAKPDEDALRLEWADICEAYGRKERAEFVRVQCELAKLTVHEKDYANCPRCGGDGLTDPPPYHRRCRACDGTGKKDHVGYKRNVELRVRESSLAGSLDISCINGWGWTFSATDMGRYATPYALVRRGFISAVSCTLAQDLEHLPAICREHPVERAVVIGVEPVHVEREPGFNSWTWLNNRSPGSTGSIPHEIWELIEHGWFPTAEAAMLALSRAVLKWAKGERR